jgi:cyclopropane fatty-acyl-phospholipid synthase-like methyltransferase
MFEKQVQTMFYNKAKGPEDLPWHCEAPAKLLVEAVAQRGKPGKALDVGCGAGVFAVYLAKQGYAVTGLDFIPKALEMARRRAESEKVQVNWVLADLLDWRPAERFDLILDSGCLHTISSRKMPRYKVQLLSWLDPRGDFILAHWGKRHLLDWRPVGPRRRTRQQLIRFFSPEFRETAYEHEALTGIPLPIGPAVLGQCFRFQAAG